MENSTKWRASRGKVGINVEGERRECLLNLLSKAHSILLIPDCNLTLVRVLKVVSQDKVTDLLLFYYVCILFLFEAN